MTIPGQELARDEWEKELRDREQGTEGGASTREHARRAPWRRSRGAPALGGPGQRHTHRTEDAAASDKRGQAHRDRGHCCVVPRICLADPGRAQHGSQEGHGHPAGFTPSEAAGKSRRATAFPRADPPAGRAARAPGRSRRQNVASGRHTAPQKLSQRSPTPMIEKDKDGRTAREPPASAQGHTGTTARVPAPVRAPRGSPRPRGHPRGPAAAYEPQDWQVSPRSRRSRRTAGRRPHDLALARRASTHLLQLVPQAVLRHPQGPHASRPARRLQLFDIEAVHTLL